MAHVWAQGMYALRERRQHVTQEDFEFAVAKVRSDSSGEYHESRGSHIYFVGIKEAAGGQYIC